jgi:hypothetical protein
LVVVRGIACERVEGQRMAGNQSGIGDTRPIRGGRAVSHEAARTLIGCPIDRGGSCRHGRDRDTTNSRARTGRQRGVRRTGRACRTDGGDLVVVCGIARE